MCELIHFLFAGYHYLLYYFTNNYASSYRHRDILEFVCDDIRRNITYSRKYYDKRLVLVLFSNEFFDKNLFAIRKFRRFIYYDRQVVFFVLGL